jgi:hypothetical protein
VFLTLQVCVMLTIAPLYMEESHSSGVQSEWRDIQVAVEIR